MSDQNFLITEARNPFQWFWKWFYTIDHKRIGLMYLLALMVFFFIGGVYALILRIELLSPDKIFLTAKQYNQVFTLHGVVMTFLVLVPAIPATFGNFILPLQLGAKDLAFPKLNLWSFYLYLMGATFALFSIVYHAVDTGWTFYAPYSTESTDSAVIPMVFGAFLLGFSSILTGINFIVSIHKLRAKGMTWSRVNLLVWSLYATSVIQVLATPVLGITLLLLIAEKTMNIGFFSPSLGGDPVLFQHFFWFYSHPVVYVMILPAMGVVSEVISTFCRKVVFGYKIIAGSSVAIALIGFLVWGHHLFLSSQSPYASMVFSFITFLVAVPSAIKTFNWVATMYKGSIQLEVPFLWVLGFLYMFTIGGLTGIALATLSFDVHFHDTYYIVAHFHFVMVGSTLMGFFSAMHYWWPKMFGKLYSKFWGVVAFCLVFIGFNITFLPQFLIGSKGGPRRYYTYASDFQFLHQLSTYGSWILTAGFVVMLIYFVSSLFNGKQASANPWGSKSLEWQTSSPPSVHNFASVPEVKTHPYDYGVEK